MIMFTESPEMVTVFERTFQLEYSESYSGYVHGDVVIEGYEYCQGIKLNGQSTDNVQSQLGIDRINPWIAGHVVSGHLLVQRNFKKKF